MFACQRRSSVDHRSASAGRTRPTTVGCVPVDLDPPELARLAVFAERPRNGDWSLRSALVRYAQANPVRVSRVLELVRRIDAALHHHTRLLAAQGPELWHALDAGEAPPRDPERLVVGILAAARELDQLADELAAWALDRTSPRPDAAVDATILDVERRLDVLGVAREERERPPRSRSRA